MFIRIANALSGRVLLAVAAAVVAFFALSALIATAFGRNPESGIADAIGAFGWFGFLISAVVLIALTVVSLIAHAVARVGSTQSRELT
jgi:uncharacterized membrane protein YdjX (TVP38/TMEM64 family)